MTRSCRLSLLVPLTRFDLLCHVALDSVHPPIHPTYRRVKTALYIIHTTAHKGIQIYDHVWRRDRTYKEARCTRGKLSPLRRKVYTSLQASFSSRLSTS